MLEALVRITDGLTKVKAKGDIICVKLSPAVWGTQETKRFLIVKLDDPALEAKLKEQKQAGEPFPVITNPYAEYVTNPQTQQPEIVVRSSKKLDIDKLPKEVKDSLANLTVDKPIVIGAEIKDKTANEKGK